MPHTALCHRLTSCAAGDQHCADRIVSASGQSLAVPVHATDSDISEQCTA